MKNLEDILQGVDPDTLIADDCMSLEESRFVTRAARNFAPLVRALQDMLEVAWPNESQPDSRTNKAIDAAKSVLNQALADEP